MATLSSGGHTTNMYGMLLFSVTYAVMLVVVVVVAVVVCPVQQELAFGVISITIVKYI